MEQRSHQKVEGPNPSGGFSFSIFEQAYCTGPKGLSSRLARGQALQRFNFPECFSSASHRRTGGRSPRALASAGNCSKKKTQRNRRTRFRRKVIMLTNPDITTGGSCVRESCRNTDAQRIYKNLKTRALADMPGPTTFKYPYQSMHFETSLNGFKLGFLWMSWREFLG